MSYQCAAVDAGHAEVRDDERRPPALEQLQGLRSVTSFGYLESAATQQFSERLAHGVVVVDQQDRGRWHPSTLFTIPLRREPSAYRLPHVGEVLQPHDRANACLGAGDATPAPGLAAAAPPPDHSLMACERILLVEDDPDLLELTAEVIEHEGIHVGRCVDAEEALRQLSVGPRPDLVLLDLALPGISGVELLSSIRADATWRWIPVVALSGFPKLHFSGLRVDGFVGKPFNLDELREVIERLCGTTSTAATA